MWESGPPAIIGPMRAKVLALLLALTALPGLAHAQPQGPTYVVQPGDTLFGIATVFGTTVEQLAAYNSIEDPSNIFPGQELVIPGYEGISGRLAFESVELGETLHSISLRTGVPDAQLGRLNRVVHPERLHAGQSFITPGASDPPAGMPTSSRILMAPGQSLLEAAAGPGLNPWLLRRVNELAWAVPAQMLWAPGGAHPTTALPPQISQLSLDPLPAVQGQALALNLQTAAELGLEVAIGPWQMRLSETGPGAYVGLQGIHALTEVGLLDLSLASTDGFRFAQPIEVAAGGYGREALIVPAETLDPANTAPEDERIAQVVGQFTSEKMWEGPFAFPTNYFETFPSFFGTRRSYNGSAFSYYHTGLDLFGSTTTPVYAPAGGRVAFAAELTVRGNATYIDHGWGVFSGFLHQSQILVEAGDRVEQGQLVGYVGGTGRVTGPHLHWEVWVGGVAVDPLTWTQREYP